MISGPQPSTDRKQALMSSEHAPDRTSNPAGDLIGKASDRFALPILIVCLLFAICQLAFNALTLDTWMDEGKYLMKGYWYLTGQVPPYSTIDPTFYMPLPFYSVGAMQWLFGIGYLPGRALAIFFAIACLVLVYLTGARIGHSRLAGVGAAVLVAGYPVTLTYFATATPYAMVSCLSLALILVLLAVRARRIAWGASGIILWALLFTRPDMLPIAMIPAGWALLIESEAKDRMPGDCLPDVPGRLSCDGVDIRARPVGGHPRRARAVADCNLAGCAASANLQDPAADCFSS